MRRDGHGYSAGGNGRRLRLRALRRADPQAPVGQRHRAAEEHHQRAEPDQAHQRIEIEPHAVGAVLQLIAEHDVEIAAPARVNAGFGGGALLDA